MPKITYTDKSALYENSNIADINKVKDSDMNEIKKVVNVLLATLGIYTDDWISGDPLHEDTYNIGDVVIYDNRLFENITGHNTTTTPDQDTTNWEEISLLVN